MTQNNIKFPNRFFDNIDKIKKDIEAKEILLFLDYDGTLTPIVATPDLAVISEDMRLTVKKISEKMIVSIVSGRATDDVRSKVQIDGIFYAGSHGFEIVDPKGNVTINEEAKNIRSLINEVHEKLSEKVKNVQGSLIENVKYTISAHYRLVSEKNVSKIEKAVDEVIEEYPVLRKTHGKKVFEIRPKIDWDKGRAVNWILNYLNFDKDKHFPIYIGDDTTDEDAFNVIKDKGFGVLVSEENKESSAKYLVKDPNEVQKLFEYLF